MTTLSPWIVWFLVAFVVFFAIVVVADARARRL